jgi:hypothetical protein
MVRPVSIDRAVSNYGPLFPTTPAPGAKEDEERTPLLTQLPSAEVLAHVRRILVPFRSYVLILGCSRRRCIL